MARHDYGFSAFPDTALGRRGVPSDSRGTAREPTRRAIRQSPGEGGHSRSLFVSRFIGRGRRSPMPVGLSALDGRPDRLRWLLALPPSNGFSLHRRPGRRLLYEDPAHRLKAVDSHLPDLGIRRDRIAYLYVLDLRRITEPEFDGLPRGSILRRNDAGLRINGGDTAARGGGADFRGNGDRYRCFDDKRHSQCQHPSLHLSPFHDFLPDGLLLRV